MYSYSYMYIIQDAFRTQGNRCRKIPPAQKDLADANFGLITGALHTYDAISRKISRSVGRSIHPSIHHSHRHALLILIRG